MKTFTTRQLALATTDALLFWSDPRYDLPLLKPMQMEWFKWFISEWAIARTVNTKTRRQLLSYLNGPFRTALRDGAGSEYVTKASDWIADRGWSQTHYSSGTKSSPLSLTSKIAFLIEPARFSPLDRYSKRGLRIALGLRGAAGSFSRYEDYIASFDSLFAQSRKEIEEECRAPWADQLARRLACGKRKTPALALQRKVLDNLLMGIGGRSNIGQYEDLVDTSRH